MKLLFKPVFTWPILIIGYVLIQALSGLLSTLILGPFLVLNETQSIAPDWTSLILITIAETIALVYITRNSKLSGAKLLFVLFLVYWGTKIFMMMIEAAFYLNIWLAEPLMSMDLIIFATMHGTLAGILICSLVVSCCKKWRSDDRLTRHHPIQPAAVLKIAAIYVPIYLAAGYLLAVPLSGDAFQETYGSMTLPLWMPVFQFGRGLLWALILWFLLDSTAEKHIKPVAAAAMAVFGAVQLLHPNPYMLEQLRAAHLIEVGVSMAVFGWLSAGIYLRAISKVGMKVRTPITSSV